VNCFLTTIKSQQFTFENISSPLLQAPPISTKSTT
jgi:hypothetical protein